MRLVICAVFAVVLAGPGLGLQEAQPGVKDSRGNATRVEPRFAAVDIFVDSGEVALGAYQVEVKAVAKGDDTGKMAVARVTLVGVAGGEHAAFASPPHYDPAALHEDQLQDRIILAAFCTGADLPKGRTKVAQLQVMVEGTAPVYSVVVMAAGAGDGSKINATATAAATGDSR